jgi:hypothetical protein
MKAHVGRCAFNGAGWWVQLYTNSGSGLTEGCQRILPVTAHEYMGYTVERIERISAPESVQSGLESVDSFDRG